MQPAVARGWTSARGGSAVRGPPRWGSLRSRRGRAHAGAGRSGPLASTAGGGLADPLATANSLVAAPANQCLTFFVVFAGAAFLTQTVALNDTTVKFEIWDTAGQERYHSLAPMYYRGAAAAIVVYDITSEVRAGARPPSSFFHAELSAVPAPGLTQCRWWNCFPAGFVRAGEVVGQGVAAARQP